MREIEIKARCADIQSLLTKFAEQNVTVSDPLTQDDQVFGLPDEKGDNINQAPWLRIRTETRGDERRSIFTLKKSVTGQLDSIEHETEVVDSDECQSIIRHLGFVPYVEIKKTRRKARVGDIEFCIDEVEGLGSFVEVEKLTDESADYETVVDELWVVFEQFGITRNDQVHDGYDVLMKKLEEKQMKALWNNEVIAEAPKEDLIRIEGNWYFPPTSLKRELYKESDHKTTCVWKGEASYYDVTVDGNTNEFGAWYYHEPKDGSIERVGKDYTDYVAFWNGISVSE